MIAPIAFVLAATASFAAAQLPPGIDPSILGGLTSNLTCPVDSQANFTGCLLQNALPVVVTCNLTEIITASASGLNISDAATQALIAPKLSCVCPILTGAVNT
ncbi:hypothetical protein HDV05_001038, partial [Chytridiales sp. JEL 0842]